MLTPPNVHHQKMFAVHKVILLLNILICLIERQILYIGCYTN